MDPFTLYESDDLTWLSRPDKEVEGTFVERKEWCTAEELARQISGFANGQPPGGLIVVGVTKEGDVKGIDDRRPALEETLGRLGTLIDGTDRQHRWVESSKAVLLLYVPFSARRVICLSNGKAFRLEGERTVELSPDRIAELRYALGERLFELEPAIHFADDLLDPDLTAEFISGLTRRNGLTLPTTAKDALTNKGLIDPHTGDLNFAGVLALGKAPTDYLPGARLRFQRFEGTEESFGTLRNVIKDAWFDGPVPKIVADVRAFMKTTIREFDYLGPDGKFIHEPEYPEFALDEAIVNALVHRSYSLRSVAVFVRMFDDRIEVESPGIFPSNARPDEEGVFPFSAPRNPRLAQALQYLDIVRLAKEGTRRMHDEMERLGLPPPRFREVQGAKVVVTLFNDLVRRRGRLGAEEVSLQWDEVTRLLSSDLAIERRQGVSVWEDLTRRNAWAPPNVISRALVQIQSPQVNDQDKARLLRLLSAQPPASIGEIAITLFQALQSGQISPSREVAGLAAHILGRVDDVADGIVQWIEAFEPILDPSGDSLKLAFEALWARLHRDRLPPREWLKRVAGLAHRHREVEWARALYHEITGNQP